MGNPINFGASAGIKAPIMATPATDQLMNSPPNGTNYYEREGLRLDMSEGCLGSGSECSSYAEKYLPGIEQHLNAYTPVQYTASQKGYYLGLVREFLEQEEGLRPPTTVDLRDPSISFFHDPNMSFQERTKHVIDISELENDTELASWVPKLKMGVLLLNGGVGSSMGLDPRDCHAKATGIRFPVEGGELAIMGAKLLRLASMTYKGQSLIERFWVLNSTITTQGWHKFLDEPVYGEGSNSPSMRALLEGMHFPLSCENEIIQQGFPLLHSKKYEPISTGNPNTELAPGGHGQLLYELYYSGKLHEMLNAGTNILVIGNADNMQARPQKFVAAKILKEDIPIAMISTDRTDIDAKGGIFVVKNGKLQIIEAGTVAKDEEHKNDPNRHQMPMFMSFGLKEGHRPVPFNTNTFYVNIPVIVRLLDAMDDDERRKLLMPDLIAKGKNGSKHLEGALATVALKFDGAKVFNLPASQRWKVFTPAKGPIDIIYLYYSDVFRVDRATGEMSLRENVQNPIPPTIRLEGWDGWNQLDPTLMAFGSPSFRDLSSLYIRGAVLVTDASFRGNVRIVSKYRRPFNLVSPKHAFNIGIIGGRSVFDDVSIEINEHGSVTFSRLNEDPNI